jgi:hypothetical protein
MPRKNRLLNAHAKTKGMSMSEHTADVIRIREVFPHNNADKLELVAKIGIDPRNYIEEG